MDETMRSADDLEGEVLAVVETLAREMHARRARVAGGTLDGDLDAVFGLDSLGRMELIARLERVYNVRLSERLFAEARTPRDLAAALAAAGPAPAVRAAPTVADRSDEAAVPAPAHLETLCAVLAFHAATNGENAHAFLSDGEREAPPITYAALDRQARAAATGLQALGIGAGERVALMLPTGEAFFATFLGALLAGAVPVPIYPPHQLHRLQEHLARQARILANAGACALVTVEAARRAGAILEADVPTLRHVVTPEEAAGEAAAATLVPAAAEDLAVLQYTSGSTGDPKGVMLSHRNVLGNIRAVAAGLAVRPTDVAVSWLPLYHDMGLITAWLGSLVMGTPFVVMSPLSFLARPERWLWSLHRNRGTFTLVPNFAFELCLSRIDEAALRGLDLSSVRALGNGSEPVSARLVRDFLDRFAPHGLRRDVMVPAYGLAECAAALTVPPVGRPMRVDAVVRSALARDGVAVPAGPADGDAQEIVSCGPPVVGHEVRIVGPDDRELPERREGRLQFRGPSATRGYFRDPEKTRALIRDGWLETGDLAYMVDGEVFITGRTKDIIVRAGRNIHPSDVESAVGALPGVAEAGVVLFGAPEPERGTERLVLAIETALDDEAAREALARRAQALTAEIVGLPADDVVLVPPRTIPHTDSGKIRRLALRESYLKDRLAGPATAPARQFRRLQAAAARGRVRRAMRRAGEFLYARYWFAVLFAFAMVLWPLVVLLPRLPWRWAVMHRASRLFLKVLGHPLEVTREAPLPAGPAVYVANHASWLDHVPLIAVLPGELSFAAKGDLADRPLHGPFLKRLETLFVERFDAEAGVADTDRAVALARKGRNLVFYPEATATRLPGLLDFRMGAFVVAARVGAPVVPVTLRGTRTILRQEARWFPRSGSIAVHVGAPIVPAGEGFAEALRLKNAARESILAHCGEPDLAAERPRY